MKKIIVLGGGTDQIDLINDLKSRGYYTILLDYTTNPIAKNFADEHHIVSTLDLDAVLKTAEDLSVDGIITACTDQALLTMAYVAEKKHFPCFLSYDKAINITNKAFMKRVMHDNCIPTSAFRIVSQISDNIDANMRYPLIVKPVDCNSSKGVVKIDDPKNLTNAITNALDLSRTGQAIVEEYVSGTELSIDAYVSDHGVVILMIGELRKAFVSPQTQLIVQNYIPANISETEQKCIHDIATKISNAFDLKNTPLLIQAIVGGDRVDVIEFSARLGGGLKHHTIETVTGFNVMKANIDSLLGITPVIPEINPANMIVSRLHLYLNSGTLASIEGTEDLIKNGICEEIKINKPIGTVFSIPKASTDRLGSILYKAVNDAELKSKISHTLRTLRILDSFGNDMLYKSLYDQCIHF